MISPQDGVPRAFPGGSVAGSDISYTPSSAIDLALSRDGVSIARAPRIVKRPLLVAEGSAVDFSTTQSFDASAREVFDLYRSGRLSNLVGRIDPLSAPELISVNDSDGTTVVCQRFRFIANLPSAALKVVDPHKLTWVEETTYDHPTLTATVRLLPDHYANKLSASATVTFDQVGAGSTRIVAGQLKVRVPLVGGTVERTIANGLVEYLDAEAVAVAKILATT